MEQGVLKPLFQTNNRKDGHNMYKKLVGMIAEAITNEELNEVMGKIDLAFQQEKITWKDHEVLYKIASRLYNS